MKDSSSGKACASLRRAGWGAARGSILPALVVIAGLGGGAVMVTGGSALAQSYEPGALLPVQGDGGPLRLFRPGLDADDSPPSDAVSPEGVARGTARDAAPRPRRVVEGISVLDRLAAVSVDAIGVLDADRGGLPVDMWAGTSRTTAARVLEAMSVAAPSPARQDLARRLLLSVAAPPEGDGAALIPLRAGALVRLGATEDARRLVDAVPLDQRTEALAVARLDSLLIDNRIDDACGAVDAGLGRWDGVYWQKALVFCALHAGRAEHAGLNLTMLREQGVDDPLFLWTAEQLSGLRGPVPAVQEAATPLTVAMLRATGRSWPSALLDGAEPWVLRAVALEDGEADAERQAVRLSAAERAALHGAFSVRELAAMYRAQDFAPDAFARPLSDITDDLTPQTGALLYQLAERQEVPAAVAEVVTRALDLGDRVGLGPVAAALYAPLIERLAPSAELHWFSGTAARALYRAGRFDAAAEWFQAVANAAPVDSEARQAADRLWPLSRLAVEPRTDRWPPARMAAWNRAALAAAADEAGNEAPQRRVNRRHARLLSLLQATGDRVGVEDWAPLWGALPASDGVVPTAPLWHSVAAAADGLRLAETVLLGLMALDRTAPADVSDAALHRVIEALRVVGLERDARRIAVEAAVASGL